MEKRTLTIIAVVVVVIIVIGGVFALTVLNEKKSTEKTIYYTVIAPALQKQAISNGTVAAGVSWEPYVSDSIVAGTGHAVLWSSEVWPNHPCCMVVGRTSWLEQNPDLAARVIKANLVSSQWLLATLADPSSDNYTKMMEIGASFSQRSTAVVENATEHIKFVTDLNQAVKDDLKFFVDQFIALNQTSLAKLNERGFNTSQDYIDDIVDLDYYEAAASVQPSNTILGTVSLGYLAGDLHQFARVVAMNTTLWDGETLFEKYGVEVTTPNVAGFSAGGAVMTAFAANVIDMAYLGAPPTLLNRLTADIDVKIVGLVNAEGSAIVAGMEYDNFDDLNNQTVAVPGFGSIQYLLLVYYANHEGYQAVPK